MIFPIFTEVKNIACILLLFILTASATGQNAKNDSTEQVLKTWTLTSNYTKLEPVVLDTLLTEFQVYNKLYRIKTYPAYLGNLGTAGISNHYFQREKSSLFFLQYYLPYLDLPENQVYFNTKKPYTKFTYTTGGGRKKQEQTVGVIHTQNVNPNFNVGLKLNAIISDGQYSYQNTSDISFNVFTNYVGNRYSIYGHAGLNSFKLNENGGIQNDDDLGGVITEDVSTRLDGFNEAATRMKNRNLHVVQILSLGKFRAISTNDSIQHNSTDNHVVKDWARLVIVSQYRKNHKIYKDQDPTSGFYQNVWIDSTYTNDSVYYRSWYNALSLDFHSNPKRKFRLGATVGIENELNKYSFNIPPIISKISTGPIAHYTFPQLDMTLYRNDTTYIGRHNEKVSNTAIRGKIVNDLGTVFGWEAEGRFYFLGYKAGNMLLNGKLYKNFKTRKGTSTLTLLGKFRNERPVYWLNQYSSNNFHWENDLKFENETRIQAFYKDHERNFLVSAHFSILGNYVFFDTLALPSQESDPFTVVSLDIHKDFSLWKFKFRNRLNIQQSGNKQVLPLPTVSFSNSTFFEHLFHFAWTNGFLLTQLGLDFYYHTPFYAYAYMPSSGRFYLQNEKEVGNYPFIDVFLNLKVKRTRIFLKYEHVTSGLLGHNYFTILHYPMNQRVFLFGFSWTFYD